MKFYWQVYSTGLSIGLISFALVTETISFLHVRSSLTVLSEVGVSLLGFGAIIFAVLYPEQRKLIAKLRGESQRLRRAILLLDAGKIELALTSAELGQEKSKIDKAMDQSANAYLLVRQSFFISFVFLAMQLLILLSFLWTRPKVVSLSIVISLLAIAIAELIYALAKSAYLPVEPERIWIGPVRRIPTTEGSIAKQ